MSPSPAELEVGRGGPVATTPRPSPPSGAGVPARRGAAAPGPASEDRGVAPALACARITERFGAMGKLAEGVVWWRWGVPLADGFRVWNQVRPYDYERRGL